jgi:hypothetical protein
VAQEEQGFGPFHPEHLPPPHLPGVVGTQFTSNLGPRCRGDEVFCGEVNRENTELSKDI